MAQNELKATLAGKAGLRAAFVNGGEDELYVAIPASFPDIVAYGELGLDIVNPDTDEDHFQTLSWEKVDTCPVDLLLLDERGTTADQLEQTQPTWANLPAVKAGQVGAWNGEVVPSPRGFADAVEDLNAVVAAADPGIVS